MNDAIDVRRPMTLHRLRQMHADGEKIAMLTCYDASFAAVLDNAGVDCLLVGDSLGMVLQGQTSTVPVTLEQMVYHTQCVARGNRTAWIVGDLPFGSYQVSREQALQSAIALTQAGAHMVKLEGGGWTVETVRFLVERGIPVCAHPLGGYRVQGRGDEASSVLKEHALQLAEAGASLLVLELIPSVLAKTVTDSLSIPVIGIGAGVDCSGQVLVLHDLLNLTSGKLPRFVRNFMEGSTSVQIAVQRYVEDVKGLRFPVESVHTY